MRDARFAELDRQLGVLAERVMRNEAQRHGSVGVSRKPRYRPRFFKADRNRHPLDRHFRCGFDPLNVTTKQYAAHIRACLEPECIARRQRWYDLAEHFKWWYA